MNIFKVLAAYAGLIIFINLVMYSTIQPAFNMPPPDFSLFGTVSYMINVIKQFVLFPFEVSKILVETFGENPIVGIIYLAIHIPVYLVIGYVFLQALFWIISKLLT
jgi:hypothetical protein